MAQRLGLAAALLGDPGARVLDEPVNGLAPEGSSADLLGCRSPSSATPSPCPEPIAIVSDSLAVSGADRDRQRLPRRVRSRSRSAATPSPCPEPIASVSGSLAVSGPAARVAA